MGMQAVLNFAVAGLRQKFMTGAKQAAVIAIGGSLAACSSMGLDSVK